MANKRDVLLEDRFYHIYNHAAGTENLFLSEENYFFFLRQYIKHIDHIADTFAYCLMPNHFHFLVKIRSAEELYSGPSGLQNPTGLYKDLSHKFGNFFNSYAKAFNIQNQRRGSLFVESFKRVNINSDDYFRRLVMYIHLNPINHGFVNDPADWKFSSYSTILSNKTTNLKREYVIEMFGDRENYIFMHKQKYELDDDYTLE
jgi:putative transposase